MFAMTPLRATVSMCRALACLAVLVLSPATARAQDASGWSVFVGITQTDNLGLTPANGQPDTEPQAGFNWTYVAKRKRAETALAANIFYTGYDEKFYAGRRAPDSVTGTANLTLTGVIIPDRFFWDLGETFGQTTVNFAVADSPSNRQNANVFTTGPRLVFPLGARNQLDVSARWFSSDFSESPTGGSGYQALAALKRQTSHEDALSVAVSASRIDQQQLASSTNYDINSAFLGWNSVRGRSTYLVNLGFTELNQGLLKEQSPLARITYTRRLTARTSLSVAAGREFSSAAGAFQSNQNFFGVAASLSGGQVTTDPFRSDYLRVAWTVTGGRLAMALTGRVQRETYDSGRAPDAKLYGLSFTVDRAVSPRLRLGLFGEFERRELPALTASIDDRRIGLSAGVLLGANLVLTFTYARRVGDSNALLTQAAFVENRETLRLTYRPRSQR